MMNNKEKLALTVSWENIELTAQKQIEEVLDKDFVTKLAIMPDVHAGYDMPIGGVAVLKNMISPAYVGFDISCGVMHYNTKKTLRELRLHKRNRKVEVYEDILLAIPVGLGKHHINDRHKDEFTDSFHMGQKDAFSDMVRSRAYRQLGTLGSGNHFIEIGVNDKEEVGITIHSGSRGCGYAIAEHYLEKGKFLECNSEDAINYERDVIWAMEFANKSRQEMLLEVLLALGIGYAIADSIIDVTHNHFNLHQISNDDYYYIHRKGATPAKLGQKGIIPINQKDGVYITEGLGNADYLNSCSHGAGRKMSRGAARKLRPVEDLQKEMKNIICRTDKEVLDEAPWAYKCGSDVISAQEGITMKVIDHFKPIIVIKG